MSKHTTFKVWLHSGFKSLQPSLQHLKFVSLLEASVSCFPDGAEKLQLNESVIGLNIMLIQSAGSLAQLWRLGLLAQSLKRNGAKKIHAIVPYIMYGRQFEKKDSAFDLVLSFLKQAGIHSLATVDFHVPVPMAYQHFLTNIGCAKIYVHDIQRRFHAAQNALIVSPDKGARERAKAVSASLSLPLLCLTKDRHKKVVLVEGDFSSIQNKNCFIIDDIIDSGMTLSLAGRFLKNAGVQGVHAYVTHGVFASSGSRFSGETWPIDSLTVTNSLVEKERKKIALLSLNSVILDYIKDTLLRA